MLLKNDILSSNIIIEELEKMEKSEDVVLIFFDLEDLTINVENLFSNFNFILLIKERAS